MSSKYYLRQLDRVDLWLLAEFELEFELELELELGLGLEFELELELELFSRGTRDAELSTSKDGSMVYAN